MSSYIPSTREDRQRMLEAIGMRESADLYAGIPEAARCKALDLPEGLSEMEVERAMSALAEKNARYRTVLRGAGAYRHYIPAIVKTVTSKEAFVTAYTPYQAEISQGVLQSIFEYQTQICELTGMDVSNASVYDGAVAAAEAVLMCQERKRSGVVVPETVDPQVLTVIETYCESRSVPVVRVPAKDLAADPAAIAAAIGQSACVLLQTPNFFGAIEDAQAVVEAAHAAGAKVILYVNPISLGLLKTPGELGADIAVGEGQPLGMPLSFGGPYLGFMACRQEMMRKLPGRIVGETVDREGRRCFVLTLQAREQHIRREKASSNICSNEALCAMTASAYLAAMGPTGLRQAAEQSAAHAHYFAAELSKIPGFQVLGSRPFFHEFVASAPVPAEAINKALAAKGILGGLPVEGGILWCCTELTTKADLDEALAIIREVSAK